MAALQEEAPVVSVWAGQDLIFFRIDMAVDDGDVDEAFVQAS